MPTINQIAKASKVSSATVSRVLNHDNSLKVSNETKMKIFEVAEKLEYKTVKERKNILKKEKKLNIIVLDWYSEAELLEDPYYLYLLTSIEKNCNLLNLNTIRMVKVKGTYKLTVDLEIDGMLAIGRFSPDDIDEIIKFTKNIVFLDSSPNDQIFSSVAINHKLGVIESLEYLIEMGHKNIAFIGAEVVGDHKEIKTDERKEVFISFIKQKGLYNENYIFEGEKLSFDEGYRLAKCMIEQTTVLPTAIFIANDTTATGVLAALNQAKISVPKDISLIGFNDLPTTKHLSPPLTSVKVPMSFMAECAIEMLLKKISDEKVLPRKTIVPCKLIVRESCRELN